MPYSLATPSTIAHQDSLSMGFFQARMLERVGTSFFRGSSRCRDWTCISWVSCIDRWILYHGATSEAHIVTLTNSKSLTPSLPPCIALFQGSEKTYRSVHLILFVVFFKFANIRYLFELKLGETSVLPWQPCLCYIFSSTRWYWSGHGHFEDFTQWKVKLGRHQRYTGDGGESRFEVHRVTSSSLVSSPSYHLCKFANRGLRSHQCLVKQKFSPIRNVLRKAADAIIHYTCLRWNSQNRLYVFVVCKPEVILQLVASLHPNYQY